MTPAEVSFRELSAERRIASVPLSHLSVEVGHLYLEDFEQGVEHLTAHLARARSWAAAAGSALEESLRPPAGARPRSPRPRISTCFLVDDYFSPFSSPAEVVPPLLAAAEAAGVRIDYLARESGCARAGDSEPARLVEGRLVPSPPPGTDGTRPLATEVGWLANGVRSPSGPAQAMSGLAGWTPPTENAARRHSVFVDVQLWDDRGADRLWSCPFLAAVWQLLRLGLLRDLGAPVADPQPRPARWPDRWDELPAVVRLEPAAAPFAAYRTFSVLPARFLPVEHAVRSILEQTAVDAAVDALTRDRARDEGIELPAEPVDRIGYTLLDGG